MTAARPWYKRYSQDFIMGTIGMDLESRGAYSLLIDMLNDRGQPIPDDSAYISGVMGISKRKWSALRQRLIEAEKIIELEGGFLTNKRFERDQKKYGELVAKRTEAGRKGGLSKPKTSRKRRENVTKTSRTSEAQDSDISKNNDLPEASAGVYQSPESRSQSLKNNSTVSDALADQFEAFWKSFPKGRKNGKKKAAEIFKRKVTNGDVTADELVAGATRYHAEVGDDFEFVLMPTTWLNQERWSDEQAAGPTSDQHGSDSPSGGNRRERIAGAYNRRVAAGKARTR